MNVAKHMAWAMNPNLSGEDFLHLVEADLAAENKRLDKFFAQAQEAISDPSLSKESRRTLALAYLNVIPTLLML